VSNFALTTASRLPRPAAVVGTWKRSPVTTPAMVEPAPLTVSTPVEPAPSAVARDAVAVGGEEIYPTEPRLDVSLHVRGAAGAGPFTGRREYGILAFAR
jgi:hypothetical protein